MLFEIFAFFGIIIALLAAMAELGQKPFFGIAASVLLLVLSFWVLLDSIQFPYATQTIVTGGEDKTGTDSSLSFLDALNQTNTTTTLNENLALNRNETTTTLYQNIPEITPAIETKYLLWLILLFVAMYGMLSYAEDIRSVAKQ